MDNIPRDQEVLSVTATKAKTELSSVSNTRCVVSQSLAEERSVGNPHVTFCGSRWRVTTTDDPILKGRFLWAT